MPKESGLHFKNDKANAPSVPVETAVLCQSGPTRDIIARLIKVLRETKCLDSSDRFSPILSEDDLCLVLPDFVWYNSPEDYEDEDGY